MTKAQKIEFYGLRSRWLKCESDTYIEFIFLTELEFNTMIDGKESFKGWTLIEETPKNLRKDQSYLLIENNT